MAKKFSFLCGGLLLALVMVAGGAFWSFYHVPAFYKVALKQDADPQLRKDLAKRFVQQTLKLVEDINHADRWSEKFTEQQVNSWLAEDLPHHYSQWLPEGVSQPRVKFEDKLIQAAFGYELDNWNTVVSCELRPWMAGPNQLAVEFRLARAGLIPIPLSDVLTEVSRQLTAQGWQVQWEHSEGNDVLVVDLNQNKDEQPVLETLTLQQGILNISGRRVTTDHRDVAETVPVPRIRDQADAN